MNDEIEVAITWWSNLIVHHYYELLEDDYRHMLDRYGVGKPTPEQLDVFAQSLRESLQEYARKKAYNIIISFGYHPDPILEKALKAANIHQWLVPHKSDMSIREGRVIAAAGYCTPWTVIYDAPSFLRSERVHNDDS